jgi:hypothetical protein
MDATVLVLSDGGAINDYLRALWTDLPLRLASLHVSGKMLLLNTSLLMRSRISAQMANLLSSNSCPPAESVFVMPPGISPVSKCARSGRNTVSWTTYRSASALLIRSGSLWSTSVMAGYQSTLGKADVALRLTSARSATN